MNFSCYTARVLNPLYSTKIVLILLPLNISKASIQDRINDSVGDSNLIFLFRCLLSRLRQTLMQMVAADWLKSDKREDDLGGRPGSIVQVHTISY